MDEAVRNRVAASLASVDVGAREAWFAAIRAEIGDVLEWDEFTGDIVPSAAQRAGVGTAACDAFVKALQDSSSDPLAEVEAMLAAWSDKDLAAAGAPAAGAPPAAPPSDGMSRLIELVRGAGLAKFTASNDDWAKLKPWLVSTAANAGLAAPAASFVAEVEAAPDKRAVFVGHGLTIAPPPVSTPDGKDDGMSRLIELVRGVGLAKFTASDDDWAKLKPWLMDTAARAGLTAAAQSFVAEVEAAPDKRAVFIGHGVTIADLPAPAVTTPAATVPAEPVIVDTVVVETTPEAEELAAVLAEIEDEPDSEPETDEARKLRLEAAEAADVGANGLPVLDDTDLDDDLSNQVKQAQLLLGLVPDGVVGDKTWDAFIAAAGTDFADQIDELDDAEADVAEEISV